MSYRVRPVVRFRCPCQPGGRPGATSPPWRGPAVRRPPGPWAPLLVALISGPAAALAGPLEDAAAFRAGGDLTTAVQVLKQRLAEKPDDAAARALLGRLYLDQRDGAAAEQEFNRALDLGLPRAELAADLARALLMQGQPARALDAAAAAGDGTAPAVQAELLAVQAAALAAMNDRQGAGEALGRALTLDPANLTALIEQARQAFARGDGARAGVLLEQARAAHPQAHQVQDALGEWALAQGRPAEAVAAFSAALPTAPDRWMLLYKRALAHLDANEPEAAEADLKAGEALFPNFVGYRFVAARLALARGKPAEALAQAQVFLRGNPNEPAANLLAGAVALDLGHLEQAREYAAAHRRVLPGSVPGTLLLAQVQQAQGDLDGAATTLTPLTTGDTANLDALRLLARLRADQGRDTDAIGLLRRLLALDPKDAAARVQLARLLLARGDAKAADQELTNALAANPAHLDGRMQQVAVAIALQQPSRALELARALVAAEPASAPAHSALAAALAAGNDLDGARRALEQALAIDPGFTDAGYKLARLAEVQRDPASARRWYEQILAHHPEETNALLALVQLDANAGNQAAGIARLEAAVKQRPDALDLRLNLANGYAHAGRPQDALRLLTDAPPAVADDPRLLAAAAELELAAGQGASALNRARRLVARTDQAAGAHLLLARAAAAVGDLPTLQDAALAGFRLDPNHPAVPAVLGLWFDRLPDAAARDQALAALRSIKAGHPQTRLFEARLMQARGDSAGALRVLGDLYAADKNNAEALALLVGAQVAANRRPEAIRTATEWLKRHPEDLLTTRRLAQLQAEAGNSDAAIAGYEAVLAKAPEDAVALNNLALLLLPKDPRQALALARRASAAAPDSPAVADTLGQTLLATGDPAGALTALTAARQGLPGDPAVTLHYARALAATGAAAEARRLLLTLVGSEFPERDQAAALLEQLPGGR